jgi:hypothetical protein
VICSEIIPDTIVFRTSTPLEKLPTSFNDEDLWLRLGKFGLRSPSQHRSMNISTIREIDKDRETKNGNSS